VEHLPSLVAWVELPVGVWEDLPGDPSLGVHPDLLVALVEEVSDLQVDPRMEGLLANSILAVLQVIPGLLEVPRIQEVAAYRGILGQVAVEVRGDPDRVWTQGEAALGGILEVLEAGEASHQVVALVEVACIHQSCLEVGAQGQTVRELEGEIGVEHLRTTGEDDPPETEGFVPQVISQQPSHVSLPYCLS